jgi:hypothetical protein
MPKYTPAAFGDGAVLARQKSAHLAHTGSFLGLALDQSESMNTLAGVAIDSVNYLIEEQRSLNGNSRFSLLPFNNKVETIRDAVQLSEFPLLDESQYQPCGGYGPQRRRCRLGQGNRRSRPRAQELCPLCHCHGWNGERLQIPSNRGRPPDGDLSPVNSWMAVPLPRA